MDNIYGDNSIIIYNEDCFITMEKLENKSIDIILTSPFYNTNKKAGKKTINECTNTSGDFNYVRYDVHIDNMDNNEYCLFTAKLFNKFDDILKNNGVILYNICYGSENTSGMFEAINTIIVNTPFTIADVIVWKKKCAMPNNCSSNKLTRIWEFVFIICRKDEIKTFHCNKKVIGCRNTGQKSYENIFNFIEAKNNDGSCPYNKSTFSSELCEKLLKIYAPNACVVYDPFMGTGTTGIGCKRLGFRCYGSELSKAQCEWAQKRILNYSEMR